MTALPDHRTPLTGAEYAAPPEDLDGARYELAAGRLMMSPQPIPDHQDGVALPGHKMRQEGDVDLEPAPPDQPGTVPGLVVVDAPPTSASAASAPCLGPREVLLTVEFLSPGSTRIDTVVEHHEYAEAGTEPYWIADLNDGPSLTVCHLAGEFGYQDAAPDRGDPVTDSAFPLRIDVRALPA